MFFTVLRDRQEFADTERNNETPRTESMIGSQGNEGELHYGSLSTIKRQCDTFGDFGQAMPDWYRSVFLKVGNIYRKQVSRIYSTAVINKRITGNLEI